MSNPPAEPDKVVYVRNQPTGQSALTMGIVALVLSWIPLVGIVLGMLAFIYGWGGMKSEDDDVRTKSRTGLILGAIAALWPFALLLLIAIFGSLLGLLGV